jgi:hypothetical protein
MNSNLGITEGKRIQTKNGIYTCVGLWMGANYDITHFDLHKAGERVLEIPKHIVLKKLEDGSMKILG